MPSGGTPEGISRGAEGVSPSSPPARSMDGRTQAVATLGTGKECEVVREKAATAAATSKVISSTQGTKAKRPVPSFSAAASKQEGRTSPAPLPPPPAPGSSSARKTVAQSSRSGVRTPATSRPASSKTPLTARGGRSTVTRSALKGPAERVAVMGTPARRPATAGADGGAAQQTPRQAAISAKKELTEQKRRKAAMLKLQQEEMKSAAKAKQAELAAEQQRTMKERAERAKQQRLAAASAKKAAREKQTERQASELQAKMEEVREHKERLEKQERARRRESLAYRSAAWEREREMKRNQQEFRQQEERLLREGQEVFREAKNRVKEQQKRAERQERKWRANRALLDKSLQEGEGDRRAYEAYDVRADRHQDQVALDRAAAEEKRLRRSSAQWGRNKKLLDREIERGFGKGLDPLRMADELFQRAESRKEDAEYRDAQRALRRQSQHRRRKSNMRRKHVGEALQEQEREREADLDASREEGRMDVAAYRQECLRRERESLDGRRQKFFDDKAVDGWMKGIRQEGEVEDRELDELARRDCQAYEREVKETHKMQDEYRRQQQFKDRLYREEEELRMKGQEEEERRIMLEDRESVLASKRREEQAELDRLEALRNPPTETTKLEILEAIWARQTHPAAVAAALGRRCYRDLPDLLTVTEVDSSTELDNISGSGDGDGDGDCMGGGSSSSSGMGIMGRDSDGGGGCGISGCSDDDSLLAGWPGSGDEAEEGGGGAWMGGRSMGLGSRGGSRDADASASLLGQSAIGLGGNVRLAEEEEEEELEQEEGRWGDVLQEAGSAAHVGKLGRGGKGEAAGEAGGEGIGRGRLLPSSSDAPAAGLPDGDGAAPAWGDVSAIEERGATSLPPTTVTAEAAAVLAAAEQSFSTDASSEEESAAVLGTQGAAGSDDNSEFPVRMLVFPEDVAGDESRGRTAADDREVSGAEGGAGASGGSGRELRTAEMGGDGNGAAPSAVSDDDGDESGVLMMSRTEAGTSRQEDEGLEPEGGRGVVSLDGYEGHGSEIGSGSEGSVRESAVLGMVRAVREEESAEVVGAAEVVGGGAGTAVEIASEDGTLASLDGNEGSPGDKDAGIDTMEEVAAGSEGGGAAAKKIGGGGVDALAAAVPATPVTPDDR
ncbi:unnamed protein product [Scytosiphon promiscuus]